MLYPGSVDLPKTSKQFKKINLKLLTPCTVPHSVYTDVRRGSRQVRLLSFLSCPCLPHRIWTWSDKVDVQFEVGKLW